MEAFSMDLAERAGVESLISSVPFTVGMAATPALGLEPVTQLVTPDLVHKQNPEEMLLTTWVQRSPDEFTVGARWPAGHPFYAATAHGSCDPMLVAETVRQTTTMLAHAAYGVPATSSFSMNGLAFDLEPFGLEQDGTAVELVLAVRCDQIRRVKGQLRAVSVHLTLYRGGAVVGHGRGDLVVVGADAYSRIRGGMVHREVVPTAVAPRAATVGRDRECDVVLGDLGTFDEGVRWTVRVDTAHPVLFDHPLDHIPGMLMLEAVRQAFTAWYGTGVRLGGMDAVFLGYAELDQPCEVVASEMRGAAGLAVRLEQAGRAVATMTVTVGSAASRQTLTRLAL